MFLSYSDMLTSFDKNPGICPCASIWSANEVVSDFICLKVNTNHLSSVIRHYWRWPASVVCVSWGCAAAGRAQWMTPSPATCRCSIDSDAKTKQILKNNEPSKCTIHNTDIEFTQCHSRYWRNVCATWSHIDDLFFPRERHCFLSAYVTETSGYSTRHHEFNDKLAKNPTACDRGT